MGLEGGTALNMFVLGLPRLSVDIGLDYIGTVDREEMLAERPKIEQAARAVFSREGFITKRAPREHAGGEWRLSYPCCFIGVRAKSQETHKYRGGRRGVGAWA